MALGTAPRGHAIDPRIEIWERNAYERKQNDEGAKCEWMKLETLNNVLNHNRSFL
jgi:hypothetical protein